MRTTRLVVALVLTCVFVAGSSTVSDAGPQMDYSRIRGLSAPRFATTMTQSFRVPMRDGVELYLEVIRPKASGRFPVIAELSPYHGTLQSRTGTRMLPRDGGLVEYFVPRGYAVMMVDLRGTGRSQGCLDMFGPRDQRDVKSVIEWAASRSWSNGRVGVIGHSYPGGMAAFALAQRPKGLATAVVSAGLASMYDHQFQGGVPYYFQWAGPYLGYPPLTIERHTPVGLPVYGSGNGGDNFGNDMEYFGCGLTHMPAVEGAAQLNALDQLSGRYSPWHAVRDVRASAAKNPVPVFAIHGVNDHAARVTSLDWFLRRKRTTDKLWLGQWDHGSGCCPNRRGYQWTMALHAWFDKHLMGRDVPTGPPVEVFLGDGSEEEVVRGARTEVFVASRFPVATRPVTLHTSPGGTLGARPSSVGAVSFAGDPFGIADNAFTEGAQFSTPPMKTDVFYAGMPKLRLAASVTMPRVYLIATLYDQSQTGERRQIAQFSINPELRDGLKKASVVVPGQRYVMHPPGSVIAHHLRKGHRLVMRVTTSDPDKVPYFSVDPNITVFTGPGNTVLELPVVDRATFYDDTVSFKR